jgi:hypothetical protein
LLLLACWPSFTHLPLQEESPETFSLLIFCSSITEHTNGEMERQNGWWDYREMAEVNVTHYTSCYPVNYIHIYIRQQLYTQTAAQSTSSDCM